jgi:hypothetical protein
MPATSLNRGAPRAPPGYAHWLKSTSASHARRSALDSARVMPGNARTRVELGELAFAKCELDGRLQNLGRDRAREAAG